MGRRWGSLLVHLSVSAHHNQPSFGRRGLDLRGSFACGNFATSIQLRTRDLFMTRSTDDTKALQWQQLFDQFNNSKLSIQKFCSQHRLSVHSFQYWSRRLNRIDKPNSTARTPRAAQNTPGSEITIELGNQVSIRVSATELNLTKSILQMVLSLCKESPSFQSVIVRS